MKKKGAPSGLLVIRIVFSSDIEEEKGHFERLKQYCESKGVRSKRIRQKHTYRTHQKP